MYGLSVRRVDAHLKQIACEASAALAMLDAEKLEELARICDALNLDYFAPSEAARKIPDVAAGMALLARVLDATRANSIVMNQVREARSPSIFYEPSGLLDAGGLVMGGDDGHD